MNLPTEERAFILKQFLIISKSYLIFLSTHETILCNSGIIKNFVSKSTYILWQEHCIQKFREIRCWSLLFKKKILKFVCLFIWEIQRQREWERGREKGRERESQAGSVLSEPDTGLNLTTPWDHDLTENQESDT